MTFRRFTFADSRVAMQAALEYERALVRLTTVCPSCAVDVALAEARRRQELGVSSANALLSVADDLIQGRWTP